jgi:hypothetical protein
MAQAGWRQSSAAAVSRCQDPGDVAEPEMPGSAQHHVGVDHAESGAELGTLLGQLAPSAPGPAPDIPRDVCLEAATAAEELGDMTTEGQLGELSRFSRTPRSSKNSSRKALLENLGSCAIARRS